MNMYWLNDTVAILSLIWDYIKPVLASTWKIAPITVTSCNEQTRQHIEFFDWSSSNGLWPQQQKRCHAFSYLAGISASPSFSPIYAYTYSTAHSASPVATGSTALALGVNAGVDLSGSPVLGLTLTLVAAPVAAAVLEATPLLLLLIGAGLEDPPL
jgi:hypothetical protein